MSEVFELPSLGADMETGTVLEWYVQPGDLVKRGALIALVSTEKADVDVEIWQEGIIAEFLVDVGQEIPVGTPLLRLGEPTLDGPAADGSAADRPVADVQAKDAPAPLPQPSDEPRSIAPIRPSEAESKPAVIPAPAWETSVNAYPVRVLASPRARVVAEARGIDLATVAGTGPGGAVLERDLDRHTTTSAPVTDRQAAMRHAIADRMAKANTEIPHYHLDLDVDMGPAMAWLERHNENLDVSNRVLPAALLLRATAIAAVAVPELNGNWVDGELQPVDGSDVAVVVSLRRGGIVTPKIADAADHDVDEVMAMLKEIVAGARRGALRSSWMSPAGISVTNLGDRGADRVHGVIFPPQVGLVGFGTIRSRPWVVDDEVVGRPVLTVSLAADHRATDGAIGSRFLHAVAEHLQTLEDS